MMTKISVLFAALVCWSVPSQAVVIHSVCPSGCDYPDPGTAEAALPSIVPTWPVLNDTYIFEWQAGQSFTTTIGLPSPNNGQIYLACKETQGSANLSCSHYYDPVSGVTITAGMPVSGPGVGSGVTVSSVSGSGPYTLTLSSAPTPPSPLCTLSTGSQTCTQMVTLYFGSAHWIVHRSNQCYEFPPGTRAGPVNTTTGTGVYPGMAKLISQTYSSPPAIVENSVGASYHRFECVEIASNTTPGNEPYYIVALYYQPAGSPGAIEHQVSDLVHHIVFDRDYIHHYLEHYANSRIYNAVTANSGYLEITNSTLMAFHTSLEGHAYSSPTVRGPIYLRNNEFETSQSGTLTGGQTPGIIGIKATGAQYLGNYYYRPWSWRVTSGTALPTNTFYPSTCMYDSNGGESYIDSTNSHWYLCESGTWTDQGAGTPNVPYCTTCGAAASTNLVCTSTANNTTLTCNDTTGVQVGMFIAGTPFSGVGATVAQVVNGTTLTASAAALSSETMSYSFYTYAAAASAITLYCTVGCSIDKTQWECKNCFGPIVDGNWMQNSWQPTMLGQGGQCTLLNQADNDPPLGQYYVPDEVESYARFTNNRCDSTSTGFIEGSVGSNYSWTDRGLQVKNNLFTNIGLPQITGPGLTGITFSSQMFALGIYSDTAFDHNTMLLNNSVNEGSMGSGTWYCGGTGIPSFISWTNSITNSGNGVWEASCGNGYFGNGFNPYALYYQAPTSNFSGDIIITNQSPCIPNGDSGNCGQYQFATAPGVPNPPINLCNGCQFPMSMSSVFQSYPTNLAVSSTYQGTGYLGTDPGADIPVVNWSTQGAVSGSPNPYLDFRVRSLSVTGSTAMYYYTAPDTGTCTLSVANNSGYNSPVYNSSDSGGNPDRSVAVTGLSPNTRYWYKLVCGASNYRRSDVFITEGP
ncbi:MAG TPA: hypothetical protein VIY49_33885 [Bryobacteraceae bacterium]